MSQSSGQRGHVVSIHLVVTDAAVYSLRKQKNNMKSLVGLKTGADLGVLREGWLIVLVHGIHLVSMSHCRTFVGRMS